MDSYDAAHIALFFDAYGEREWERFGAAPLDRVSLHLHQHYLGVLSHRHARARRRRGPGRFTIKLAELGAKVTALDISSGQLEQHRRRLERRGSSTPSSPAINSISPTCRVLTTLRSIRPSATAGRSATRWTGPMTLSQTFTRHETGWLRAAERNVQGRRDADFLAGCVGAVRPKPRAGRERDDDARAAQTLQQRARHEDVQLGGAAGTTGASSVRNRRSVGSQPPQHYALGNVLAASTNPELWERLLEWELKLCAEPGNLDGGTHILSVYAVCKAFIFTLQRQPQK